MSSPKEYALIEINYSVDRLPNFAHHTSLWAKRHSRITSFDFDNHSESYTIELALKLVDETDATFLLIASTDHINQLGGSSKFLNRIVRKFKGKVSAVYISEDAKLAPFFKVLKAKKCENFDGAKDLFDTWVKELQTDQHLPERESDL